MPQFFPNLIGTGGSIPVYDTDPVNPSIGDIWMLRNLPPTAPVLSATVIVGSGTVTVTLQTASTDADGTVLGYNYYRSTDQVTWTKANISPIATAQGGTYQHTGLTNGTTYYFMAKAVDNGGAESSASATVSGVPIFSFIDNFNNSSFDTTNFGTIINSTGTVIETSQLTITIPTTPGPCAAVYLKTAVGKQVNTYKHRYKVTSTANQAAGLVLCVTQSATSPVLDDNYSNRRLFAVHYGGTGYYTILYKRDSGGTQQTVATSTTQQNNTTFYDAILEVTATTIKLSIKSTDGLTTYATTGNLTFGVDIQDNSNPFWLYWGEVGTSGTYAETIVSTLFQVS